MNAYDLLTKNSNNSSIKMSIKSVFSHRTYVETLIETCTSFIILDSDTYEPICYNKIKNSAITLITNWRF